MEMYSFALGRQTKEQRQRQRQRQDHLSNQKRERSQRLAKSVPRRKPWLLLPFYATKGFEFWISTMKGDTFLEKRKTLQDELKQMEIPGMNTLVNRAFQEEYKMKANVVMELLVQNQELRWVFKRFFTQMRIKLCKRCNDVDPITMEPIVQPIQFPSFYQRKLYVFEAKSFAKHLHTKLVQSDGHIPQPQIVKNPLTNEVLPLGQLLSLIQQVKSYGHSSWAIEAFCASRYDLPTFLLIYSKPLRHHALRTTMAKFNDWDCIDTLYDFIKSQYEFHAVYFPMSIYKWAVHHAPSSSRIESWRKMCVKWYEVDILIEDEETKQVMFRLIELKTRPFCCKPIDLTVLRARRANIHT